MRPGNKTISNTSASIPARTEAGIPMSASHPHLEPCPFCGKPLAVNQRKFNPHARCITVECKGAQLPLLNLDIPEDIDRWNTRNGVLMGKSE